MEGEKPQGKLRRGRPRKKLHWLKVRALEQQKEIESKKEIEEENGKAEKEKEDEKGDGEEAVKDNRKETENEKAKEGRPRKSLHWTQRRALEKHGREKDAEQKEIEEEKEQEEAEKEDGNEEDDRPRKRLHWTQRRALERQGREKDEEVKEIEEEEEKEEAEKENENYEEGRPRKRLHWTQRRALEKQRQKEIESEKKREKDAEEKEKECSPRKKLHWKQMRALEKQKDIESEKEREKDTEEKEIEEEKEEDDKEKEKKETEKEIEEEKEAAVREIEKEAKENGDLTEFAQEATIDGVRVSIFDYSVENFFHAIDEIASICGTNDEESFEPHVIQRFSSSITFLREWKQFYYQPKTIRFSYETGSPHEKDVNVGISLPVFSAANVPMTEKQSSDKRFGNSSNDFVLQVGGQVWGLDWCPRNHQRPDFCIKCEYLAVSAHPPDSSYHKMGVPLIGRGVIQIWCVLNSKEEEPPPTEPKKRGRKRLVRTESCNDLGLETKAWEGLPHGVLLPCKLGETTGRRKASVIDEERPGLRNASQREAHERYPLPRLVLCLAHNAKVAWDVKWRPYSPNDPECKHHLGFLAVLLGNGSLEVWEVPFPRMIKSLYTSIHSVGTDPRFMKLEPVFRCLNVKCGDRQSIPLTLEWSTSPPHDMLLAGCHDGTVALWKFSASSSPKDTRPLLCFTADTVPIRALAWAPDGSDPETKNLIVTAGHEGLRFWDIRDPYRPLWDLNFVRRVLSLDWLHDPRCLILSVDDGTLRLLSLLKAAYDVPVTGKPFVGTHQQGFHSFYCSSFSLWSVHVSRFTGQVAYCGADGSALHFQLTTKAVEKDPSRHKEPHFLCGSLTIEDSTLTINTPLPNVPCSMKKFPSEGADSSIRGFQSALVHVKGQHGQTLGTAKLLLPSMKVQKPRDSKRKKDSSTGNQERQDGIVEGQENASDRLDSAEQMCQFEVLPPKIVSMHRVRWNTNKGSERLLCYGGAAGIIRCQVINTSAVPPRLPKK